MANLEVKTYKKIYRSNWKMFLLNFSTFFLQLFLVAISYGMFIGTKLLAGLDVAIFKPFPYFGAGLFIFAVAITSYQFILAIIRF